MQYRLDKHGNKISVLGYGCMRFTQKAGRIDILKAESEIMEAYKAGEWSYSSGGIFLSWEFRHVLSVDRCL